MSAIELISQSVLPLLQRKVGVKLINTGKRFNREWIFRHCSYTFEPGKRYAITGSNGSGKSTLLQVISGSLTHNEGDVQFTDASEQLAVGNHYQYISMAAPYLELIEEMTADEFLSFHNSFKALSVSNAEALEEVHLQNAIHKQIRYFSSGMKQRLKLAQAFFSKTPVLLLDEPTTNLDLDGIALYHELISNHTAGKLVIISSNDTQEYHFCDEVIEIAKYK
jgi:ABC-type multidrug transport system ATPase subunit